MNKKLTILVAEDHAIVRRGIVQILKDGLPFVEVTEVADAEALIKAVAKATFDIVVTDLSMPGRNGLEALQQIKQDYPKLPVLVLSIYSADQYAIRAFKAGASGYLTKDSAPNELISAVQQILQGKKYVSQASAEKLVNMVMPASSHLHDALSNREFEVFKLLAKGKSVSDIAQALTLSLTTISTYRSRILEKMNLKTNADLIFYAIENKLVD